MKKYLLRCRIRLEVVNCKGALRSLCNFDESVTKKYRKRLSYGYGIECGVESLENSHYRNANAMDLYVLLFVFESSKIIISDFYVVDVLNRYFKRFKKCHLFREIVFVYDERTILERA